MEQRRRPIQLILRINQRKTRFTVTGYEGLYFSGLKQGRN